MYKFSWISFYIVPKDLLFILYDKITRCSKSLPNIKTKIINQVQLHNHLKIVFIKLAYRKSLYNLKKQDNNSYKKGLDNDVTKMDFWHLLCNKSHNSARIFFLFQYIHMTKKCVHIYIQIFIYRVCTDLGTRSIHLHTVIPVSNLDVLLGF